MRPGPCRSGPPVSCFFVAERATRAISVIDSQTGARTVLSSGGGLENPTGIAVRADGRILVTDRNTGGILGLLLTAG